MCFVIYLQDNFRLAPDMGRREFWELHLKQVPDLPGFKSFFLSRVFILANSPVSTIVEATSWYRDDEEWCV